MTSTGKNAISIANDNLGQNAVSEPDDEKGSQGHFGDHLRYDQERLEDRLHAARMDQTIAIAQRSAQTLARTNPSTISAIEVRE